MKRRRRKGKGKMRAKWKKRSKRSRKMTKSLQDLHPASFDLLPPRNSSNDAVDMSENGRRSPRSTDMIPSVKPSRILRMELCWRVVVETRVSGSGKVSDWVARWLPSSIDNTS